MKNKTKKIDCACQEIRQRLKKIDVNFTHIERLNGVGKKYVDMFISDASIKHGVAETNLKMVLNIR